MLLGLALAIAALFWFSTRPGLSPKARMPHADNAGSAEKTSAERPRFVLDLPNTLSTGISPEQTDTDIETEQNTAPDFELHEQAEKVKTRKFHIVHKNETLSDISYKYYGSANKWQKIFNANRSRIKDANTLRPGTKLIIPE